MTCSLSIADFSTSFKIVKQNFLIDAHVKTSVRISWMSEFYLKLLNLRQGGLGKSDCCDDFTQESPDLLIHVTLEFFTLGLSDAFLSDYLTVLSYTEQNKIHQKLSPVGFELTTFRSPVPRSANWASKESVGDVWSELYFMHHFTCWTLFISRINRAWLYKGLVDSHPQPISDLAQLIEHGTDDLEVVSSNPTGTNFWRNLFCSV